MAKFGYVCKCGWRLTRGLRTRKEYAAAKRRHAMGNVEGTPCTPKCEYLFDELSRTTHSRELLKQELREE